MGPLEQLVQKHGTIKAAAMAAGVAPTTFNDRLHRERGDKPRTKPAGSEPRGLTQEELLLRHSPEHQVQHAAEALAEGAYIPEPEFIRDIGLTGGYRHIVEREEFAKYRGKASGGAVYWSHPASIKEMKTQHVLR